MRSYHIEKELAALLVGDAPHVGTATSTPLSKQMRQRLAALRAEKVDRIADGSWAEVEVVDAHARDENAGG